MSSRLEVPALLARTTAGALKDKLRIGAAPTVAADVPASAGRVTKEWLSAVLCGATPGAAVSSFKVVGGSDGTSSRRALRIAYNAAGTAAGLPEAVFTKSSASLASRILLGITGITRGEAIFFNDLRPAVELRSPRGFHANADPATGRSIVLMEDLAAEGWSFPDPMENPISERDAQDMVEQMARYHATFWDGDGTTGLGQLPSSLEFQQRLNRLAGFERRFMCGMGRSETILPASLATRGGELWSACMRALELNVAGPQTLLHQDLHRGNWLRDPDGRMGLYDWQCVARGGWALDVSYALIAVLAPEDRRAWQHDLVRSYLEHLRDNGVESPPEFDDAWRQVRQQTMHSFVFAIFTNGQPRFAPDLQPPDYTRESIRRIGLAVDELDTLGALS